MTKQAVRKRPDLNTSIVPGARALHIAAKRGDVEIVRLLLQQAGADLNATDKKGCTPLLAACNVHASTVLFGRFFFFFFFRFFVL